MENKVETFRAASDALLVRIVKVAEIAVDVEGERNVVKNEIWINETKNVENRANDFKKRIVWITIGYACGGLYRY